MRKINLRLPRREKDVILYIIDRYRIKLSTIVKSYKWFIVIKCPETAVYVEHSMSTIKLNQIHLTNIILSKYIAERQNILIKYITNGRYFGIVTTLPI